MDACYNADGSQKCGIPAKVTPINNHKKKVTNVKPKILFIGDSISANVDIKMLSHATEAEFKTVRAYSSIKESTNKWKQAPRFPDANFTDVVPAELGRGTYHYLVLQAPSVDITNMNTTFKLSELEQQTNISVQNFFKVVESALKVHQTLKKVIVLKLIPRYDPPSVDPMGMKSALSNMFNEKLEELWRRSYFQSKVFVGSHNIDCTGAIRESRYFFLNIQTAIHYLLQVQANKNPKVRRDTYVWI